MNEKKLTPMQSIRKKCLDCCCNSYSEVRACSVNNCPLYPYRYGKRPKDSTTHNNSTSIQKV